ncbi:MAG: hypothetical protein V1913_17285 [Fibrobacterota bacterium]
MPENLDTILLVVGSLTVVVSIIVNILSTVRLSRLSETINRLEERVEKKPASEEKGRKEDADSSFDSSILPAPDVSDNDSHSTRYRPPGSRAGGTASGTRSGPGSTRIKKAGMRVPETIVTTPAPDAHALPINETVPEPAAEARSVESVEPYSAAEAPPTTAVPAADTLLPVAEAVPEPTAPVSLHMGQEEEELLKNYFGDSTRRYLGAKAPGPAAPAAPKGAETADESEGGGEEDVMDVILDTGVYPAAVQVPDYNPFDASLQRVNFAPVRAMLAQLTAGARVTLDFQDVLFLVEDEYGDLTRLAAETAQRNLVLAIRNVSAGLQAELSSKIPTLTYL